MLQKPASEDYDPNSWVPRWSLHAAVPWSTCCLKDSVREDSAANYNIVLSSCSSFVHATLDSQEWYEGEQAIHGQAIDTAFHGIDICSRRHP